VHQSAITNLKSKIRFSARLARRTLRRTRQTLRYGSLDGAPVLFANSFPKSGTHLLTQVMAGFTRIGPAVDSGLPAIVTFRGDSGRQRAEAEILTDLQRLLPGDIAYGHIHALPGVVAFLIQPGMAAYFILRDPRDVVVSHVHYITEMAPSHIHHRYYEEKLDSFGERLSASIQGISIAELQTISEKPIQEPLPDIRARFEPYMGWLVHPEVMALRYEDFITGRDEAVSRVFDHALQRGFKPACGRGQAVQAIIESIDPQRSPTFRSGKIGGWQKAFTPKHKQLFKEITGDLLIRLSYEASLDW
jgi:hypothetical protein